MFDYKILIKPEEKELIKRSFFDLFSVVYGKNLNENLWNHQIINSPYSNTPLFVAMDRNKIVGSAVMILQKCIIEGKEYKYFLFTTSSVMKEYRPKGIYAELLKMQKEYAKNHNVDFIFAFPNKMAYPVLKLFGGFKDLKKDSLVKTTFENLNLANVDNSLLIDSNMFQWRFEHKNYQFHIIKEKVIVFKEFEGNYDLLAIYKHKDFSFNFTDTLFKNSKNIITLSSYIYDINAQVIDIINATYFPINKNIDYSKLNINLLMSDVF